MMFSVITPCYIYDEKRKDDLLRNLHSVEDQTYPNYEQIVVEQSDTDFSDFPEFTDVRWFRQPHLERLHAYKKAFSEAKGDWFVLIDSDDMMLPNALETYRDIIKANPDYKMFNFGSIHIYKNGDARVRGAFKPKELEIGHEMFGGGNIVNGTFIFHRSVWEDLGDFPENCTLTNPWDFSAGAQRDFPELKPMFIVTSDEHPEGVVKELGNPWGQDFWLFYKYTRKYKSLPFDKQLLCVYCK